MKVTVDKKSMLKGIQTVQNAVSPKSTLPVLSHLLIDTQKNRLNLFCTDLELGINTNIPAEVKRPGSISLPVKKLGDIIKELPEDKVTLEVSKNQVEIECRKSFFKIFGLPKEDFPKTPHFQENQELALGQRQLKNIIKKTFFAVSSNETRYVLNGLYFQVTKDGLVVVGTDGRRLACVRAKLKNNKGKAFSFIVPIKAIQELLPLLKDGEEEISLRAGDNQISFLLPAEDEIGEIKMNSRLIEGKYPNFEQVIPKEVDKKVKIKKEEIFDATRRVSLLTSEKSNSVKMSFFGSGKLLISANTPEVGEAKEELTVPYKKEDISIAFNPDFLIEVFRNMESQEITFGLSNSLSPGVITPDGEEEDYTYVIMPMRLG